MTGEPSKTSVRTDDLQAVQVMLVRAVKKVCPPWLAEEADDLVQEAFLKLLKMLEADSAPAEVNFAYIKRMAYSTVVDEVRKRQRRPAMGHEAGEQAELVKDQTEDPSLADTGVAIQDCLTEQIAERRRAVTLHLLGHTVAEVATLMECKSKRAENWVYRGMAQLRECLTRKGLAAT